MGYGWTSVIVVGFSIYCTSLSKNKLDCYGDIENSDSGTELVCLKDDPGCFNCTCHKVPRWMTTDDAVKPLGIEIVRRSGCSLLISNSLISASLISKSFYSASYTNSFLSRLPDNICSFPRIVSVNFSHNLITEIGEIRCLVFLDTLQLSLNRISYIKKESFKGLKYLRVLDLSNNFITDIEPLSLTNGLPRLFWINLENNHLKSVSIKNVVLNKPICNLNYGNNRIKEITGLYRVNQDTFLSSESCGFLDLSNNLLQSFPKFLHLLDLSNRSMLSEVLHFKFSLAENFITCDCKLYEYLAEASQWLEQNWIEYSDMKCGNPFESQMTNIKEISKYQKFDSLVCNISRQEGCPFPCFCHSKPSKRHTVVNCSSFYLTQAPKHHIKSKHPVIYIFKRHSTLHGSNFNISLFCDALSLALIVAIPLLGVSIAIVVCINCVYKEDIYLLSKRLKFSRMNKTGYEYDAYICLCESNIGIVTWALHTLLPYLESYGYSIFFPPRDEAFGGFREEEIIMKLKKCRNYIFLMTEDFEIEGDSENALWCGLMWKNAWKNFRERSNDLNIIIVNCDYLRWKNSKNKVLKAYLRQQLAVDFSNKKHEVLDDIRKRMGVPKALASVFSATASNYNNCNN